MEFKKWFQERVNLVNKLYEKLESEYDVEILHQYRVNLRKLHACSEIYTKQVDKQYAKYLSKNIKYLLKPTSSLRDLDLLLIESKLIDCSEKTKIKLYKVVDLHREKLYKESISTLNRPEYRNSLETLYLATREGTYFLNNLEKLDKYKIIKKLETSIYSEFGEIDENISFSELHSLRKKFKKFRYAQDIYNLCFNDSIDASSDIKKLKKLQDFFGAIQDSDVRLAFVRDMQNEFYEEEFLELESYFQTELSMAKEKLFKLQRAQTTAI